jgi:DNA-binding transcriptional MocR family regulator
MISPTLRKLRYRPGIRVGIHAAPAGFDAQVATASAVMRAHPREKNLDIVQAFFTRRSHLERSLPRLKASLGPRGILWICYPKGQALATDLSREAIRETVAQVGLQTVAIVAVDDVWSALRVKPVR